MLRDTIDENDIRTIEQADLKTNENDKFIESRINLNRQWKASLLALYEHGYVDIPTSSHEVSIKHIYRNNKLSPKEMEERLQTLLDEGPSSYHKDNHPRFVGQKLEHFLELSGIDIAQLKINEENNNQPKDLKKHEDYIPLYKVYLVNDGLKLLSRLEELKLASKKERKEKDVDMVRYTLTSSGLDVVLKLIEHQDKEDQFETQIGISGAMKRNSNISLLLSIFAAAAASFSLYISWERLEIAQENIEKPRAVPTIIVNKNKPQVEAEPKKVVTAKSAPKPVIEKNDLKVTKQQ